MLIDARHVGAGTDFRRDVCIVGAGPAGISLALALRGSGLSVALIESGGFNLSLATQKLYQGENVGHRYFRLDGCRYRMFGGSTNRWGGWSRPMDPEDYESRPWVANSGWPISEDDVQPYYARTAELLELSTPSFELDHWSTRIPEPFALDEEFGFRSAVFQYSPQTNFGERYRDEILDAPKITTFLHANVTDLRLDDATARVGTVEIQTLAGNTFAIKPRLVILAAGGLENPRLLLAARRDRKAGLGNERDTVGRYFQEHLHVPAGHLFASAADLEVGFYRKATRDGAQTRGILTPTLQAQERYGLLTCSIAVEPDTYTFGTGYVGWPPHVIVPAVQTMRALQRGRAPRLGTRFEVAAQYAYERYRQHNTKRSTEAAVRRGASGNAAPKHLHSLYFRTEQAPDPQSRVLLTRQTDALGVPRIALDWRVSDREIDTVGQWLQHLGKSLDRAGVGSLAMPPQDFASETIGGPHHIGTTRMSADPSLGVVDGDAKVHSVDNLYVAGSSVFATGGYTNPTFTLISLALRLADRVRTVLA